MNLHQRNEQISKFIKNKLRKNETFSVDELEYLQTYTGSGGLAKHGATGRGLLYEYYTPDSVIEKMWGLAYKYGFESGRILEPSCGTGRFLKYINPELNTVDAYEFAKDNDTSYQIAKACFSWVNIKNDYFESIFYQKNKRISPKVKYDLVIGNPPYGEFTGFYAGKSREGRHFNGRTYDQYFIWAGIELLKYNGLLIMIVPSSFLKNDGSYDEFKYQLSENAKLIDAYRLPVGTFDSTQIQTDIVVFQKK